MVVNAVSIYDNRGEAGLVCVAKVLSDGREKVYKAKNITDLAKKLSPYASSIDGAAFFHLDGPEMTEDEKYDFIRLILTGRACADMKKNKKICNGLFEELPIIRS